ncbi:MAG: bifunctional 3-deoxy-7-phosphoheptulonate synthase/chorismate mutase type II [Bacteroidetes bacterium]|nr:bifunctional 3-deoxy-7-phosphoheptulonate synthase/chorismate mutase type II [Bacteroidota bacterium]
MSKNTDIYPLNQWISLGDQPLVIAGPCSAESREQLLQTAIELAKIPLVKIFRAGIWKPRTRPDGFEGMGIPALAMMKEVKETTGLLTAVEVATARHIEDCLEYGIDVIWIGARTVGNPFSVQELAEALKGVDIPVLIKNPLNPDLKLWLGAIERINNAGIKKIAAVHRGFYTYNSKPYRNAPLWELPIELKRILPDLPIISDPSHIAGNRTLLRAVAQKALDLEVQGLMVEVHNNPDAALTDAQQQLTPAAFNDFLSSLIFRNQTGNKEFENKLLTLRSMIDDADDELIQVLAKRMNLVTQIGEYKKQNNITILQIKRWNEIICMRVKKAKELGLSAAFIQKLLEILHDESIQIQTDILDKKDKK